MSSTLRCSNDVNGQNSAPKRARIEAKRNVEITKEIQLTENEVELFDTIKAVLKQHNMNTVVRVAGGWVRDKILGHTSHDIDIALDDTTGIAFAERVNKYLSESGKKTRRIGLIQANPEQSKHLETATVSIMGLDIDFVNLRSETYEDSSRIPKIEFGSALEDAVRRDFTINSLFYNINESKLEDFTGKGFDDLSNKVIRTPLVPFQTFRDDPLRMLRAIRFASRFQFSLDPQVVEALRDATNLEALKSKISKERIGTELVTMLRGANPALALELLCEHNLMPITMSYPEFPRPANPSKQHQESGSFPTDEDLKKCKETLEAADWNERVKVAKHLMAAVDQRDFKSCKTLEGLEAEFLPLVALLNGWGDIKGPNYKWKLDPLPFVVIRDGLKLRSTVASSVQAVVSASPDLAKLARGELDESCCLKVGHLIIALRELYPVAMTLCACLEPEIRPDLKRLDNCIDKTWNLTHLWKKPLPYNGKELIKALGKKKGGPYVGEFMKRQTDWLILDHSSGLFQSEPDSQRERCLAFILSIKDEIFAQEEKRLALIKKLREEEAERRRIERDERIRQNELFHAKAKQERIDRGEVYPFEQNEKEPGGTPS